MSGKITSILQLYEILPSDQRMMMDVLRQLLICSLPYGTREKLSFNVPFFYKNKGLCIIWPAAIPRGGISSGVLLGFWYGNKLKDTENYLVQGSNKKVFYKIFNSVEEIKELPLKLLLEEASGIDEQWKMKHTLKGYKNRVLIELI